jgi:hypothetical protein
MGAESSPRRPCLTARPCNRWLKVESGPIGTGPSASEAARPSNLLTLFVISAKIHGRAQVTELAQRMQEQTGQVVKIALVDQDDSDDTPQKAAIQLIMFKRPDSKYGFVLLSSRWVIERSFAWIGKFRALLIRFDRRDIHCLGAHYIAFTLINLRHIIAGKVCISS